MTLDRIEAPEKKPRKPPHTKRSKFYHLWRNKLKLSAEETAQVLAVDMDTLDRFNREGAPEMAERLLLIWHRREIAIKEWHGFRFEKDYLVHGQKRWTGGRILMMNRMYDTFSNTYEKLNTWKGVLLVIRWNMERSRRLLKWRITKNAAWLVRRMRRKQTACGLSTRIPANFL